MNKKELQYACKTQATIEQTRVVNLNLPTYSNSKVPFCNKDLFTTVPYVRISSTEKIRLPCPVIHRRTCKIAQDLPHICSGLEAQTYLPLPYASI